MGKRKVAPQSSPVRIEVACHGHMNSSMRVNVLVCLEAYKIVSGMQKGEVLGSRACQQERTCRTSRSSSAAALARCCGRSTR